MICSGINVTTGESVAVEFEKTIRAVRPGQTNDAGFWIAPGFVDLQVNGFAGVDFNDPNIPLAEIARATDAILSTGVTRFLPTIITGSPEGMLASLRNLRRAQTGIPRGRAIAGFH